MKKVKTSRLQKDLQELLEKMTVSEKRDFKKNARFWGGQPNYLKLFDYLNLPRKKTDPYPNTENIRQALNWSTAELSSVSRYLYDKIISSLRIAPQYAEVQHDLHNKIQDIHILIQKEIYPACLNLIETCKARAIQIDKPLIILEILFLQKRMLLKANMPNLQEALDALSAEERKVRAQYDRHLYLYDIGLRIALLNQNGEPPPTELVKAITQLTLTALDKESPNNQILFYQIQTDFLRAKARIAIAPGMEPIPFNKFVEDGFQIQQQVLNIFRRDDVFLHEYEEIYLGNLDRLLSFSLHLNRLDQFKYYEKVFRKFRHRLQYYQNIVPLNLMRLIKEKKIQEGCWFIEEDNDLLERRLHEYRTKISPSRLSVTYFTCAQLFFISEKFNPALKWLQKVELLDESKIQPELVRMAHLLTLVVQHELGTLRRHDRPEAFVDHLALYLKQKNIDDAFAGLFLQAMRAIAGALETPLPTTLAPFLVAGKKLMARSGKDHPDFLLLWWMDSRVSGVKMSGLADRYL